MKRALLILLICCCAAPILAQQGRWFLKKEMVGIELPTYARLQELLPKPIYNENPLWVETYWKAWEIACKNFYNPTPANGFVTPYIDAAFNNCIFLWDTSFMTMFCNYGYPFVPGIASLDNFYCKQYDNGEICREIRREDGGDCDLWVNDTREGLFSRWGYQVPAKFEKTSVIYCNREAPVTPSHHTLDNMNHPIMAWAELESYSLTGSLERLKMVYEPLKKQYAALKEYLQQGNGLYMTDWASMDNAARNRFLVGGGVGVDISCEMVLFARNLAEMARIIGLKKEVAAYQRDAKQTSNRINKLMWSEQDGFYYDLTAAGRQVGIKSVAGYWALLAGVADVRQSERMAALLSDEQTFGRKNQVPTLSASEASYSPEGNYWCGSVWAPTTTMVIAGLERYGHSELAREIALNHVAVVADVYQQTGTIWENYAPDKSSPGYHADGRPVAKEFVGWSGIAPVKLFIEYALGIRAHAPTNTVVWELSGSKAVGCRDFRFNDNCLSLLAAAGIASCSIEVEAEKAFTLRLIVGECTRQIAVVAGKQIVQL